ncbi:hypothetical protein MUK42_33478 [Musa troglodytarum]|uniref:Uncharacterized protein n=1 Tax=Musa troglodytarum TaxID=320322 RepID=A0A9E7JZB2_9LILI|nr:hypothetical protein MUK42_33478 [Musa troglodytarum]
MSRPLSLGLWISAIVITCLSEETPTQTFPYPSIADSLSDLQTEGGKRCLRRSRWRYFLSELFVEAALLIWELGGIR